MITINFYLFVQYISFAWEYSVVNALIIPNSKFLLLFFNFM